MNIQKLKDGVLIGIGFMLVIGVSNLAYAAFSWITQTSVTSGQTLTAGAWNDMLNNQNYLKQEVESKVTKAGDVMVGILDMGSNKITNAATPTANNDVANKAYVDSVSAAGGDYQLSCSNAYVAGANFAYCVRFNTITGVSECKYINGNTLGSGTWAACYQNPF